MTEYGYSINLGNFGKKVNRKGCKYVEVSSFNLTCDISSYGYKVEYNQYIEAFNYPNYNDLEDIMTDKPIVIYT